LTRSPIDRLATAVGTSIFIGYFPIFPGTVGSLPGLVIYVLLSRVEIFSGFGLPWLVLLGVVFAGGAVSAHRCEKIFGNDDKRIVIDEVWGMMIALQGVPVEARWLLSSFLLFRFFDIIKPYPARRAERLGGGAAIMLDDGIAGFYTAVIIYVLRLFTG